ncbi:GLPGLI family protein [Flavobacterium sp. I3-2]|uniref:GLPGLI family protein n=1 Tax=Flavobacterium sp. I3-2 TaxID=2748319 RepID=UPI0015AFD2B1|nr:GLPGLI family protein [Flavobacterium sp. I3-2]
MNKSFYLLIFCIFSSFISFAQFQGLFVTYKEVFDTDRPIQRLAYLHTTPNFSVFEEDYKSTIRAEQKLVIIPNEDNVKSEPLVIENNIVTTNLNNKKIETFDYLYFENKSKIVDTLNLNWELINEKQIIDKIECYKAIVNFRGRKWIAWYAPSIPYSSGPYKFHGLPGLIIKLYDESNKYNYVVEKIEFLKEEIFTKKIAEVESIPFNQQQTLKDFMLKREQILENGFNTANKDRGTIMIRQKMPRKGIEIEFEWEE